jgi:hypothetical protein
LVVFKGDDFISRVIQVAQNLLVEQKDQVNRRWSHVGVIVDRNVLPLPYMDPGKLYVYESVLSGTAFGYQYSSVQSVDHPLSKSKRYYAGPQIRPFVESVKDVTGLIAIAKLNPIQRLKIDSIDIQVLRRKMLGFHAAYNESGYPFTILPQIASANDGLYRLLQKFKNENGQDIGDRTVKSAVFCSEFAAKVYQMLEIDGFTKKESGRYSPAEMISLDAFDEQTLVVKGNAQVFLKIDGKSIELGSQK